MPMHDWTTVESGTYHTFHQRWAAAIMDRLNAGLLPPGYYAMLDRAIKGPIPDVIAFREEPRGGQSNGGGAAVLERPKKSFVLAADPEAHLYAHRANRITVLGKRQQVVAVIEIVSPGNKDGKASIRTFIKKMVKFIRDGVNVMIIDPFPPGPRDPEGVHPLIWDEFLDIPFKLPRSKKLTFASYQTSPEMIAYVEPIAVGHELPDMPLFLKGELYVDVPLEETYQTTCNVIPAAMRAP